FTALHSTNAGLRRADLRAKAVCSAKDSALAGGTIESSRSTSTSASADTPSMPASFARFTVAGLRPVRSVTTFTPCSCRRRATPAPMLPAATIATSGFMRSCSSSLAHLSLRNLRFTFRGKNLKQSCRSLQCVEPRLRHLAILRRGEAADADAANDFAVDHDGQAPFDRR